MQIETNHSLFTAELTAGRKSNRARKPRPSSRKFSTTAASSGAGRERWLIGKFYTGQQSSVVVIAL
jgi:hypothetical protein